MAQISNIVSVDGMIGEGNEYFADSPVVITVTGLDWPADSPFNVVRVKVLYNSKVVGEFPEDTGGQTTATFDISTALKAIWSEYDFSGEVGKANTVLPKSGSYETAERASRPYILNIFTEYINDGVYTETQCVDSKNRTDIPAGSSVIGGMTAWERSRTTAQYYNVKLLTSRSNKRFGTASTKPTSTPERVGKDSITSWVDVYGSNTYSGTRSVFYTKDAQSQGDSVDQHAPIVLRDSSQDYTDFLFVNRRGAVETCSALMLENMGVDVSTKQYARIGLPSFKPSRSLMTITESGPRRSWGMSSGYVTREWAEWWATEFLPARRVWMRWQGPGMSSAAFVPVIVEPAKKSTAIYDRAKQNMPHVDFTVTLALEG